MNLGAALAGGLVGTVLALGAFAPASWLARAVADATGGRVLLADAQGTVWNGSAAAVLTGGEGARDAARLPGRLEWRVGIVDAAPALALRQGCCTEGEIVLRVEPGWGSLRVSLASPQGVIGQWPAAWLSGLGTPWNTLRLDGGVRLSTPGVAVRFVKGRWQFDGSAEVDLVGMSSPLAGVPRVGSYRLALRGDAATGEAALALSTREGPLRLDGTGQWAGSRLRFRGQARADDASAEAALGNLLNIIGRRQGAISVISIG